MHVPFTQNILTDWAGYKAFKDGMTLFENGKVDTVTFDPPFVTGKLLIGVNGMSSKFEVLTNGLVENHCPCRDNREEGIICPHLVALGLEAIRLYSDPMLIDQAAAEKRRSKRVAMFDASAYHTRDPNGTPATLHMTLR